MLFGNRKGIKEIGYFTFPEIYFEQNDSRLCTYSPSFFFFPLSVIFFFFHLRHGKGLPTEMKLLLTLVLLKKFKHLFRSELTLDSVHHNSLTCYIGT